MAGTARDVLRDVVLVTFRTYPDDLCFHCGCFVLTGTIMFSNKPASWANATTSNKDRGPII